MRLPTQRGLKFGPRTDEIAAQMKRDPQNRMRQLVGDPILHRSGDG